MVTDKRLSRMKQVLSYRQTDLTVVCENIHDPHNVSAILRSCDAVGILHVHLMYTSEDFPKLGKKSSASAKKWLEIHRYNDYQVLQNTLNRENKIIYATHLDSSAQPIYQIDWTKPSAIILGNEHRGVSKDCLEISDEHVFIPMFGMVESLNVSVAAAVILYEAFRQRLLNKMYPAEKGTNWVKTYLAKWSGMK